MTYLRRTNSSIRAFNVSDPTLLWSDLVRIAVTSNNHDETTQIRVLLLLKTQRYGQLIKWADDLASTVYPLPGEHFRNHQLAALIRKYPLPEELSGLTPEATAMRKFLAAENRCRRVNSLFRAQRRTGKDRFSSALYYAKNWIQYVIGEKPDLRRIAERADFGDGSSVGVHGNATNWGRKFSSSGWTVSPSAVPYALGGLWANSHIQEYFCTSKDGYYCVDAEGWETEVKAKMRTVAHNIISFVPKTAKTHRAIAVEPTLNAFIQTGIESELTFRLKRVGLDISDQSKNQELARLGSLGGDNAYCTIDLSSASDTLATEVVRDLLPPEWFDLLNHTRSHSYKLADGTFHKFNKFVSMGNGFCFPLETLIFASLCHAAACELRTSPDFRVYGDDIIVRQDVFPKVLELLKHFGFIPNPRKTFSQGPFRESCGADWHSGENVRPIWIDEPLSTLGSFFSLYNETKRRGNRVFEYFREIREFLFSLVPPEVRFVTRFLPENVRNPITLRKQLDWAFGISTPNDYSVRGRIASPDSAFWVESDDCYLSSPHTRYVTKRPVKGLIDDKNRYWIETVLQSRPVKDDAMNEASRGGLIHLMACLRGATSSGPFTLRFSAQNRARLLI